MNTSSISNEALNRLADRVMEELNRRWEAKIPPRHTGASGKVLLLGTLPKAELQALQGRYEVIRESSGEWEMLLAADLSVETMAYAAHGIAATPEAACILQGLLTGRQVCLLEQGLEYRKYKETAPKTIYLLYQNQEKTLRQMGIRFLRHSMDLLDLEKEIYREQEFAQDLFQQRKPEEHKAEKDWRKPGEPEADLSHLMLLQESELIKARGMGYRTILLNRKAKITPLALDYLKNHGLTIHRQ